MSRRVPVPAVPHRAAAAPSLGLRSLSVAGGLALGPVTAAGDGGPLWTVLGLGGVLLLAYLITRVITAPLLRSAAARPGMQPLPAAPSPAATALRAGDIEVDPRSRVVSVAGQRLDLTDTEFRLLSYLVDHSDQVLSRADLLRDVWGHKEPVYSRTVDTHIQRLRDKLGAARGQLETVRGVGYRLRAA